MKYFVEDKVSEFYLYFEPNRGVLISHFDNSKLDEMNVSLLNDENRFLMVNIRNKNYKITKRYFY